MKEVLVAIMLDDDIAKHASMKKAQMFAPHVIHCIHIKNIASLYFKQPTCWRTV